MIAKQLANEAYESIITARNTSQISWDEIQNASACSGNTDPGTGGIFMPGQTQIYNSEPTESTGLATTPVRRRCWRFWRIGRMESITRQTIHRPAHELPAHNFDLRTLRREPQSDLVVARRDHHISYSTPRIRRRPTF